ncbi:hypothetical protein [Agarivorans sp. DSG3-1]|uniref:hypothetical protein n=1 Tax=Agarivorans sp. DSG3-1 TaxID=3342249 RepID=UPI00398ECDC1
MPIIDMSDMPAHLAQQVATLVNNPNWQAQRQQLWDDHLGEIYAEYKRSKINALKLCFFSGQIDKKLLDYEHLPYLFDLFPVISPDSICYLIDTLLPLLEGMKMNDDERKTVADCLIEYLSALVGAEFSAMPRWAINQLNEGAKLDIFDWLFGSCYQNNRPIKHSYQPDHPGWPLTITTDKLLLRLLLRLMSELANNSDLRPSILWQRPNYLASLIAALPDSYLTANWDKDEDKQDTKTYLWIALAMGISSATASLSPRLQALKDKHSQLITTVTMAAEQRPLLKQLLSDLQAPSAFFKPILEYAEVLNIQIGLDEANLKIWQQHFNELEPREGQSETYWGFVDLRVAPDAPDDPDNPDLVLSLLAKLAPQLTEQWLAIRALNIDVGISLLQKPYHKNYALLFECDTRCSSNCDTQQAEQALVALLEQLPITALESWMYHTSTFIKNRS